MKPKKKLLNHKFPGFMITPLGSSVEQDHFMRIRTESLFALQTKEENQFVQLLTM